VIFREPYLWAQFWTRLFWGVGQKFPISILDLSGHFDMLVGV
jgi:hypothetical protein